jgi:hypothetical protein
MDDLFGVTEIAKQLQDEEAHHEPAAAATVEEKTATRHEEVAAAPQDPVGQAENKE